METEPILISITDDQNLFREGLSNIIDKQPHLQLIHQSSSGEELLAQLMNNPPHPHIALIDLDMPGMNGMELNQQLQKKYPDIRVVVLSVHNQPSLIAQMIHEGADAYLEKNCGSQELNETICRVHQSGFFISRQVMEAIQKTNELRQKAARHLSSLKLHLTEREKQVLTMICKELSTQEISDKLFISPRTVEGHKQNLLLKTGCKNTAGLVIFALKNHVFILDENKFSAQK